MLKDDRMMGMLTFVVIMLAVGTFIQRTDFFERLFGPDGPPPRLVVDEAIARAAETAIIDVLANDANVGSGDASQLAIVILPECGRAFVQEGRVHYLGGEDCIGAQTLRYGLGGEQTAALRIAVEPSDGEPRTVEPPADAAPGAAARPEPPPGLRTRVRIGTLRGAGTEDGGTAAGEAATQARPMGPDTAGTAPARMEQESPVDTLRRDTPKDESTPAQAIGPDAAGATPQAASAADPVASARDGAAAGGGCSLPPTLTLDTAPGAMTTVSVDSPCHAGTVAEFAYDGLHFAVPLDARGAGTLAAPGFQRSAEATLTLENHEPMTFSLPFQDIERIERIAVVWQAAEGLALNAFEFGARPGSEGHVRPDAPRSFAAVRREGGGWLSTYAPAGGRGQRVEVYSFWRRYTGPSGVVKLGLDPGRLGENCAGAAAAGADYEVLRSSGGQLERTRFGRIGALDCARLAGGTGRFIGDAIDDLIVRRR